ncbi:MAG: hypothetical protein M3332_13245 [Actinomycetota bacterium]|nr:hypothetical protein [Actinomycetota bacterium]
MPAVRLYADRLRDHGESKLAARTRVGELFDMRAVKDSAAAARAVADGSVLPVDVGHRSAEDGPLTPEFRTPQDGR